MSTPLSSASEHLPPLRLGIAGLGTVGAALMTMIADRSDMLEVRLGRALVVTAVSARDRGRDRGVDLTDVAWEDNAIDLAKRDDVDLVVELMGGSDGPALALARAALSEDKGFITANKALMAHHGKELAGLAEQANVPLAFEAAVAGGIPVIKALREGLNGNHVTAVRGILNGTGNYILTEMEKGGRAFADVLKEAQAIGYAEADPSFDVDGIDTAHKITLLAEIAFSRFIPFETVRASGIRSIAPVDIDYADHLGYRIKLLGVARLEGSGVAIGVYPAMVPKTRPLAEVGGATNAVEIQGDAVGETVYVGAGAGGHPTASAVLADIMDAALTVSAPKLARSMRPIFGTPTSAMPQALPLGADALRGTFYIRLRVTDEVGVMAEIASTLAESNVSIDSLLQRGQDDDGGVYVVIITHEASEADIEAALSRFQAHKSVLETPTMLRVETG